MRLSVCSTTFNAARFVDRWHAMLSSGLWPTEFVVVDNESTDGTAEKLRALGCRVISKKCSMGEGRNLAVAAAKEPYVFIADADNDYLHPRWGLSLDRILVTIDEPNRSVWSAAGPRELFLHHPFLPTGGSAGREDFIFFARTPLRIRVIHGFGEDLQRREEAAHRPLLWLKNDGWWSRKGLTTSDALVTAARMARGGGWRYAFDIGTVLGAHLLTLGRSERSP
jgi:glycosyltransferase involved in cell wall biosynthesis